MQFPSISIKFKSDKQKCSVCGMKFLNKHACQKAKVIDQRNKKYYYHICPETENNIGQILDENFICKGACKKLIPESERIEITNEDGRGRPRK